MGIWINEVDYSPLYNAIDARRRAETGAERRRAASGDLAIGLMGAAVDLGKLVYDQAVQTNLAKLKLDLQKAQQEAEQRERDIVLNGNYEYETTQDLEIAGDQPSEYAGQKTIKMPEEYEQWFKQRQSEIQEKYKAFPELVTWGLDQLYAAYADTKSRVLGEINKKNVADQAVAENELLTGALAESVKREDPSYYEAALRNAKSLTPAARPAVEEDMRKQYEYGVLKNGIVKTTQTEGVAAGLSRVQAELDAKKLDDVQAEEMRNAVSQAASDANTLYTGKAQTEFVRMKKEGISDEFALANAGNGTPDAYRANVDKLLRAAYEEEKRQSDWTADAEMLEWHGANATDGWGLWKKLHDPQAQYNTRMTTSTFTFWERYAQGLMDNGGTADEDVTTPEALDKLIGIVNRTDLIPERKREEMRKLYDTETIGWSTYTKFLGYTDDKVFSRDVVLNALKRIDDYFKTPEALKGSNPSLARQQALDEFARQLETASTGARGGQLDDDTIDRIASDIMKPGKPQQPKADQVPSNARTTEAARMIARALAKKGALLNPTEQTSLGEYIEEKLAYHYGVSAGMIVSGGADQADDFVPYRWVKGLNPADPNQLVKLSYRTDDRGALYPAIMDSTGNWIPFPLETNQDRDARMKKAAEEAARAAKATATQGAATAGQTLNASTPAAPGKPATHVGGTVASIRALAAANKTTADAAVLQAQGNAGLGFNERSDLQERLDAIKGKIVSAADVERFAKEMKQRVDYVWAAILDLGYKVGD